VPVGLHPLGGGNVLGVVYLAGPSELRAVGARRGPEDYFDIDPVYRFWLWPADVREAVGTLNLTPSPRLVGAA
jgi:hypothetical protein